MFFAQQDKYKLIHKLICSPLNLINNNKQLTNSNCLRYADGEF